MRGPFVSAEEEAEERGFERGLSRTAKRGLAGVTSATDGRSACVLSRGRSGACFLESDLSAEERDRQAGRQAGVGEARHPPQGVEGRASTPLHTTVYAYSSSCVSPPDDGVCRDVRGKEVDSSGALWGVGARRGGCGCRWPRRLAGVSCWRRLGEMRRPWCHSISVIFSLL